MCVNIEVTLPVVKSFLFRFPLRAGCVAALAHTAVRALVFALVATVALLELAGGTRAVAPPPPALHVVFFSYLVLLMAQAFLLVFLIHLWLGIFTVTAHPQIMKRMHLHHLEYFLVCRAGTWLVEVGSLAALCARHRAPLLARHLAMLLVVIPEAYLALVVYSYYVDALVARERRRVQAYSELPCSAAPQALSA